MHTSSPRKFTHLGHKFTLEFKYKYKACTGRPDTTLWMLIMNTEGFSGKRKHKLVGFERKTEKRRQTPDYFLS